MFLDARRMQDGVSDLGAQRYRVAAPDIVSGETPARQRQAIVDRFGKTEGFAVLILSPRAAGIGLNITAATYIVHLDRWRNPASRTSLPHAIPDRTDEAGHCASGDRDPAGFGGSFFDAVLHGILTFGELHAGRCWDPWSERSR